MPAAAPLEERFWPKVNKNGPVVRAELGPCWQWTASVNPRGYGQLTTKSIAQRAHRVSWELANGPVPPGLCVLHRCDNRRCVRPEHLFLGTFADNMRDMAEKGRATGAPPRGERNPSAKLTANDVMDIRSLKRAGAGTTAIARRFGVSLSNVKDIVKRRIWQHVA